MSGPGVHRLVHASGTSGVLLARGPWSLEVRDLDGPDPAGWLADADRTAAGSGALDLRATGPLPGATPLSPGADEHVRPVPVRLADPAATRDLGRRVGRCLRAGDLVVLSGPLGAGKTTFAQGLGEALGVRGRVTSPTFVLAREHRGPVPLLHVDAYRVRDGGPDLLADLDLEDRLEDGVVVVEWGDGVVEHLAASRLDVRLARGTTTAGEQADTRTALLAAHGLRWTVLRGA